MNARNILTVWAVILLLSFSACENSPLNQEEKENTILPERFKIDIPGSLSNNLKSASLKSTSADTLNGNHIYWYLNTYIAVGEGAADIVEAIMWSIRVYHIEDVISLTYSSDDDNRLKNLEVISDVEFGDRIWEYQLTITDAESEGNEDGGIGMQVCWNKNPIEGIAMLKPYNIDRKKHEDERNLTGKITYSEKTSDQYDAFMVVELAGIPVSRTFDVETLKMFVGKKGDLIDVIGNSNHPKARFNIYSESEGFNWAFAASGDHSKNIAVAEVGLPMSSSDITSRVDILEENSIKTVLTREMTNYVVAAYAEAGITLRPDEIANYLSPYLKNAEAPGYFESHGFVKGGSAPDNRYNVLETRLNTLTPYSPVEISNLKIDFNY